MGIWDSITGGLNKLFGGGGMAQNAFNNTFGSKGFSGIVSGAGNAGLGGFGSGMAKNSGGGFGSMLGGLGKMFGGGQGLAGLGMMGIGSMIPNAKAPAMPAEFTNYMSQLNQGGTPGMRSANQYYTSLMNADMNDPYVQSLLDPLNQAEEEDYQKRTAMYKSLRPGSDPMSDAAWARDEADAKSRWAKEKTYAVANAKNTAAGALNQQGSQLAGLQGSAVQQYVDQIAQQWGLNASQRNALRESIMNLGGSMIQAPMQMELMKKMFPALGRS